MKNKEQTTEASATENTDESKMAVNPSDGPLKHMLVDYVGKVYTPENGEVTVEMVIETLASEFPEFLFVVAKENWLRGYQQAMTDVDNYNSDGQAEQEISPK
jgi:hypothetical protein|tara:strand:- start:5854 stop:6159 length:306 start_codon:yes stop_codon:yes gene_type:complete